MRVCVCVCVCACVCACVLIVSVSVYEMDYVHRTVLLFKPQPVQRQSHFTIALYLNIFLQVPTSLTVLSTSGS